MPAKDTKISDPKYLEALAKAREKALLVRRQKSEEKKEIKAAADFEHQQKLAAARTKLGVTKPSPPPKPASKPEAKPERKAKSEPESEQELEAESSVSSVESAPPQAPPPKPKQPNTHRGSAPMRERPSIPQQQRAQPSREQIAEFEWRRLQASLFGY